MERKSLPKPLRIQVWNKYVGEENGIGKCNVCGCEIKVSNFDCGHIISARDGGEDILNNLVPICRLCNLSMGTDNLNDFKKRYFNEKTHVDIFIKSFLKREDNYKSVSRFMGLKVYDYPHFLSLNEIYKKYREWIFIHHTEYYIENGMNSWIYSPDKNELSEKCSEIYGKLTNNPETNLEWGFLNVVFK